MRGIAAAEFDRVALLKEPKQWPRDLVGGSRLGSMQIDGKLRDAILNAELMQHWLVGAKMSGTSDHANA